MPVATVTAGILLFYAIKWYWLDLTRSSVLTEILSYVFHMQYIWHNTSERWLKTKICYANSKKDQLNNNLKKSQKYKVSNLVWFEVMFAPLYEQNLSNDERADQNEHHLRVHRLVTSVLLVHLLVLQPICKTIRCAGKTIRILTTPSTGRAEKY